MSSAKIMSALGITVYFGHYLLTITDWHFIDNVNLIFHEAGHIIFIFAGDFLHVAAGSLLQILVPLLCALYFIGRREFFSASVLGAWTGQSIVNVSVYAKDALVMQLLLLGGDNVGHDWNYLLTYFNVLKYTNTIGSVIQTTGVVIILICFAMMWYFAVTSREEIVEHPQI